MMAQINENINQFKTELTSRMDESIMGLTEIDVGDGNQQNIADGTVSICTLENGLIFNLY